MRSVVVITGAGRGIGAAIALRVAEGGNAVVGIDVDETAIGALADSHPSITGLVGDVRDQGVLDEAARAAGSIGTMTGWVNNAGVTLVGPLHAATDDDIDRILGINLVATVRGCRTALATFLSTGTAGSIVNVSSIHAKASFPGWAVYDATKGAVEALTRTVCAEYGHLGIRCNAVAPGAVATEIFDSLARNSADGPEALFEQVRQLSPMRMLIRPEQVASCVSWLLSREADAVNGHVLAVDAGALSRCIDMPSSPELHR